MGDGTYGTRTVNRRQRYRCTPVDGSKPHSFTPPLARDHVHVGSEQWDACEGLRGVHHGEPTVARQHTWPASIVARALSELAADKSYGEVSLWALRATKRDHSALNGAVAATPATEEDDGDAGDAGTVRPKHRGTAAAKQRLAHRRGQDRGVRAGGVRPARPAAA